MLYTSKYCSPTPSRIYKVKDGHYRIVINLGRDPITGSYKKKRKEVHGTRPEPETVRQGMLEEPENPQKPASEQPRAAQEG